jgi:CheY-like chemotaxis protein
MSRKPRILIVDDDSELVQLLSLFLEDNSYEVVSANSAPDGMFLVERQQPDIILLDIMMPRGTEGFHFVWNLRNHELTALRKIPIVIMSGMHATTELRLYPNQADAEYAPGEFLPVQAYLDKPFEQAVLLDELNRVLQQA